MLFISRYVAPTLLSGAVGLTALTAHAEERWDTVGLRFGMTEQEITSAIQSRAPDVRIDTKQAKFSYQDGEVEHWTEDFIVELEAQFTDPSNEDIQEHIIVKFTPPPSQGNAFSIYRSVSMTQNRLTRAEMTAVLTEKYGEPDDSFSEGASLIWVEDGKFRCGTRPDAGVIHIHDLSGSPRDLQDFYRWREQGVASEDFADCSATLFISVGGLDDAVAGTGISMVDPGLAIPALEATVEWLRELEDAAHAERMGRPRVAPAL